MRQPLVSIYTPTYNRNQLFLDRALKSVLNQTYTNFEYIVVSDGLNYDLMMLLGEYNDKRIRYYEIERKEPEHNYDTEKQWYLGGTHAANYALGKIRGDWIARLDDDDIWSKDHLEKSLQFALEGNYDFITSQYVILKENHGVYVDCTKHGVIDKDIKIGNHSSWFYNSKLRHLKYNPLCYFKKWNRVNDVDLLERLFKLDINYGFLDEVLTFTKVKDNENEVGLKAVRDKIGKY